MPRKARFAIYTVRLREKHQREFEALDQICGQYDLLQLLNDGLNEQVERHSVDQEKERVACLKRIVTEQRVVSGIFHAGHFGEATDIVDSMSAALSYEKKITDAEMLPCFFRLEIPKNRDEALLVLQKDVRVGAKGAFLSLLNHLVSKLPAELSLEVRPIVTRKMFEQLVGDGVVQTLRFIKLGLTKDFEDSYDQGTRKQKARWS